MTELKPCPFCGGIPHFEHYGDCVGWGFKHTCKGGTGDSRRIAIYANHFETKTEAEEAWNRRAEDGK